MGDGLADEFLHRRKSLFDLPAQVLEIIFPILASVNVCKTDGLTVEDFGIARPAPGR
jgi:hypothetical protein